VCVAPDAEGRPVDPLKELALENSLPVHQPTSWKTDESVQLMKSFDADVCMMAYVLMFVPKTVRDAPRFGSFQYHPSLLPMHRGPSSINWPIAMGETRTGLSIFWPDDGFDEGPILLQKTCDIGPDETLGDVYFKKLFPMGVDAMMESLELVRKGEAPRIVQNLEEGSYESWFGKKQARIDWSRPAHAIYNIIRAGNPQPGAWTLRDGVEVKIFDSELSDRGGEPGVVVAMDDDSIIIAAGEGAIRVKRVRAGAGKVLAAEYVASSNLSVGDRFG
jgi:methionyl-tRNA formyltransferase